MEDKLINDVREIKNTLTRFGLRLELIFNALNGNELSKDGGLVADILEQKNEIKVLTSRVLAVEAKEDQRRLYVRLLWAGAAALITIIINKFIH